MSPEAVSKLSPAQILCLLGDDQNQTATPDTRHRDKAQRQLLDMVCARFAITRLHLLAQPIETTKAQILELRPEMRAHHDPFHGLLAALKAYGAD